MLTRYQPKTKIVEKIYTQADGKQIRVLFLVALVNGELKVKPISAQAVENSAAERVFPDKKYDLFLPVNLAKSPAVFTYSPAYAPIVSPYTQLNFFISQPTRAPSFE